MADTSGTLNRKKRSTPHYPEIALIVVAVSGWMVLVANMFGIAGKTGWIFPVVTDIGSLAKSTGLLALISALPFAFRLLRKSLNSKSR